MVQLYDAFTINTILFLEDLGFCKKGEGGAFVSNGNIAPKGGLPVNTNGGGLSYCHPGMYGLLILIEGVRQLRGECGARQVQEARRRDGARQWRRALGAGERDFGDGARRSRRPTESRNASISPRHQLRRLQARIVPGRQHLELRARNGLGDRLDHARRAAAIVLAADHQHRAFDPRQAPATRSMSASMR